LDDTVASLIDTVGNGIDLGGEVIVHDDGNG
jgi:hypothetical protein